ncbi:hypothetical protein PBI_GRAVY_79 [Gordonia phage Gravy]|uniref:Uncharacterized protein n=2 Tax=Tanisvirus tanis TaxID=2844677 RepID=A0A2P1JYK2_9CAUD|nr:hypothetical protein PBI_GRAVY_79 [Gordonia phage Gravy]AVO25411.1 hypothetical protein PBI_KERRY_79 [Gordonia phage Kerry]
MWALLSEPFGITRTERYKTFFISFELDITKVGVEFELESYTRFLNVEFDEKQDNLVHLRFNHQTKWPNCPGDLPTSYLVAGRGYKPQPGYKRIKTFFTSDGLMWKIYAGRPKVKANLECPTPDVKVSVSKPPVTEETPNLLYSTGVW